MTAQEQLRQAIKESGLSKRNWYRTIYLQSDHWHQLRQQAHERYGNQCSKCKGKKHIQVHHLKYRSIFNVKISDLQVLCKKCHKKEHQKLRRDRRLRRAEKAAAELDQQFVKNI